MKPDTRKYTQKELRNFVRLNLAIDITQFSIEKVEATLLNPYTQIGYSCGIYGLNGAMLQDTVTGQVYVITHRNTLLSYLC